MEKYKKFLRLLLAANITFIFVMAFIGYRNEDKERKITQVSGTFAENKKDSEGSISKEVIPVGKTVGIYVNTKGILVIDTGEVTDLSGKVVTPAKNKLMPGDYILELNGETVKTKKQLISRITDCGGEDLVFKVMRGDDETEVKIQPVQSGVDTYKVGIWVRDDLQGLGTVTYVDGKVFGALGHSINDTDTGSLLEVSGGEIYEADIFGVERGESGKPGIIEGMITYQTENVVGNIEENRVYGIYGEVTEDFWKTIDNDDKVRVASSDEVMVGPATIQSYVDGKKTEYAVEILNIHKNDNGDKEMEIKVKDAELIKLTGGIVQGMSGSPIIKDGKLIGAVTHVFVDDPTRGYGIFIEEMLK